MNAKRTLITGGASGLGLAMAKRFSAEGGRIAIFDTSDAALAQARSDHPDWLCTRCDVASESSVSTAFDLLRTDFGGLDILVSNAGNSGPAAPIEEIDTAEWQAVFDVNVLSAFFCMRHAVPMLKANGGAIIIMSSAAGRFGFPMRTPYASAKWALIGLTKSLASELGPFGIRVNAILPGMTGGARLDGVIRERAEKFGRTYEEQMAMQLQSASMRVCVEADDISGAALYLASDDARRVTGISLPVDAGLETVAWR